MRLQKYIADAGITSRRKAEQMILDGRVEVNGQVVTTLGTKVDGVDDVVSVDGEVVDPASIDRVYCVLHKPRGFMTTLSDPEGRKTVMDLMPKSLGRVYPVGRLDYLSEGLLVMTNDGKMANDIIHPSSNIIKVYEVKIFGAVDMGMLKAMREGLFDPEVGEIRPKSVRVIKQLKGKTWVEVRLQDGKNREIRRLCEGLGLTIDKLKRVAIGGLTIQGIAPGAFEFVTKKNLIDLIGLNLSEPIDYQSPKKSIKVYKKAPQDCPAANAPTYLRYRKENYFETLKQRDEKRKMEEIKIALEQETKEAEKLKKRAARDERLAKKREGKNRGVHAIFVD